MTPTTDCPVLLQRIQSLLRRLGASGHYYGFRYAVRAVEMLLDHPDRIHYIVKGVYLEIAGEYHTTPGCVERNIRTVVRRVWEYPDHALLDEIAGYQLYRQPTNTEFLDMIAQHLKTES